MKLHHWVALFATICSTPSGPVDPWTMIGLPLLIELGVCNNLALFTLFVFELIIIMVTNNQ